MLINILSWDNKYCTLEALTVGPGTRRHLEVLSLGPGGPEVGGEGGVLEGGGAVHVQGVEGGGVPDGPPEPPSLVAGQHVGVAGGQGQGEGRGGGQQVACTIVGVERVEGRVGWGQPEVGKGWGVGALTSSAGETVAEPAWSSGGGIWGRSVCHLLKWCSKGTTSKHARTHLNWFGPTCRLNVRLLPYPSSAKLLLKPSESLSVKKRKPGRGRCKRVCQGLVSSLPWS